MISRILEKSERESEELVVTSINCLHFIYIWQSTIFYVRLEFRNITYPIYVATGKLK